MSSQIQTSLRLPDWSALPADALEVISNLTADDADYIRFRSVCTAWRSTAPERPRIPWLLILYDEDGDADNPCLGLCNFPSTEFSTSPRLSQSIIRGKVFCGSSHGWIALQGDTQGISLHNPFTCAHIDLSDLTNLRCITKSYESFLIRNNIYHLFGVKKVIWASDPRLAPYAVVAIVSLSINSRRLIYYHSGDVSWTVLQPFIVHDRFIDIISYEGKFYAVQTYRMFLLCDIGSENPLVTEILPTIPLFSDGNEREGISYMTSSYLVESSGDLLLVTVILPHMECDDPDCVDRGNFRFEVFRVDLDGRMSLFKLDTLGGRSLFLGCSSMSVSAPNSPRFRGNCIYFLPDIEKEEWEDKIVVFSMDDGEVSFVTAFSDNRVDNWEMHWLTPSLC